MFLDYELHLTLDFMKSVGRPHWQCPTCLWQWRKENKALRDFSSQFWLLYCALSPSVELCLFLSIYPKGFDILATLILISQHLALTTAINEWKEKNIYISQKPRQKLETSGQLERLTPGRQLCEHSPIDRDHWWVWWRGVRAGPCGLQGRCCRTQPWSTLRMLSASPTCYRSRVQKMLVSTRQTKECSYSNLSTL